MPTDDRVLTAMAHPLRRRLLDVLRVDGPSTASMLAERTNQGVGNVSHHIRILADAGLVAEAPELARDRRERWWRRPDRSITWATGGDADDPAAEAVELAAESTNLDHQIRIIRTWMAANADERAGWPEGPFSVDAWLRVTPTELSAFAAEIMSVVHRWSDRDIPDDGQHRDTVFAVARAVPAQP